VSYTDPVLFLHTLDFTPRALTHDDYEHSEADIQFQEQKSLGRQTVVQFEIQNPRGDRPSANETRLQLKDAVQLALRSTEDEVMAEAAVVRGYAVGTGCVVTALWPTGTVALVWNGEGRIDVNLFTREEDPDLHSAFIEEGFVDLFSRPLSVLARDEQPRGINRVVNFKRDKAFPDGYYENYEEKDGYYDGLEWDEEEEEDDDEEEDFSSASTSASMDIDDDDDIAAGAGAANSYSNNNNHRDYEEEEVAYNDGMKYEL